MAKRKRGRSYPDEVVLEKVRTLAAAREGVLTLSEFCRETGISATVVDTRFGGWLALRARAGLPAKRSYSGRGRSHEKARLLEQLKKSVGSFGSFVTQSQFCQFAGASPTTIANYWGNWRKLRAAAELPERPRAVREYREINLFGALCRLSRKLDNRFPSAEEINRYGEFSLSTYLARFGSYQRTKEWYERVMARLIQAYRNEAQRAREAAEKAQAEAAGTTNETTDPRMEITGVQPPLPDRKTD